MEIMLYGRVAPHNKIHVWFGASGCIGVPNLKWTINGHKAIPCILYPLQPIRKSTLTKEQSAPHVPKAFFGIFGFNNLPSNKKHRIRVISNGRSREVSIKTLPDEIPEKGFHILLASCFHSTEADHGKLEYTIETIKKYCPDGLPHMSLLLGDQVYLDLPTDENFPDNTNRLADIFEKNYLKNWSKNSFVKLLSAAPFIASPDDHEYWNNYPHAATVNQNTWRQKGRDRWTIAAKELFEGFQAPLDWDNNELNLKSSTISIPPVSLFNVDTRSGRLENTFMPKEGLDALDKWVDHINNTNTIKAGIFISGQSLYKKKAGFFARMIADKELANYDDFEDVVTRLMKIKKKLICVTGDVHWGRVIRSVSKYPQVRDHAYEVIVSPSSLVTTLGADTFNRIRRFWKKWPRHSDAEDEKDIGGFGNAVVKPKPYEKHQVMPGENGTKALIKGNQIALLSFSRNGAKLAGKVQYWNIDNDPKPILKVNLF